MSARAHHFVMHIGLVLVWLVGSPPTGAAEPRGDAPQMALFLINADGSNLRRWIQMPGYRFHGRPSFSPNGDRVAFEAFARSRSQTAIYLDRPGRSMPRPLSYGESPSWSPDASKIAFCLGGNRLTDGYEMGIWTTDADGENQKRIGPGEQPVFSPDGKQIAYVDDKASKPSLVIWELASDARTELASGDYERIEGPVWSPDSRSIAFLGIRDIVGHIVVASAVDSKAPTRALASGRDLSTPAWRPEGQLVTYYVNEAGNKPAGLYEFNLTSGKETLLHEKTTRDRRSSLCWSTDGSYLAFSGESAAIVESTVDWRIGDVLLEGSIVRLSPFRHDLAEAPNKQAPTDKTVMRGEAVPPVAEPGLPALPPVARDKVRVAARRPRLVGGEDENGEAGSAADEARERPWPFEIETGSDEYQVVNKSDKPLRDFLVVLVSAEGRRVGWLDRLPIPKSQVPRRVDARSVIFPAHDGPCRFCAFAPDGKRFATGGDDGIVKIWDLNDLKASAVLSDESDDGGRGVLAAQFTADGKRLFVGYQTGAVRIWNVEARRPVDALKRPDTVRSLAISPDGALLAAATDQDVRVLDVASGRQVLRTSPSRMPINAVAVAPDGMTLAIGMGRQDTPDAGGGVSLFAMPAAKGDIEGQKTLPLPGGESEGAKVLPLNKGELEEVARPRWAAVPAHARSVFSVAFSPEGSMVASCALSELKFWDVATGKLKSRHAIPLSAQLAFSPDGRALAIGGHNDRIHRWNVETERIDQSFVAPKGPIASIDFSPDGSMLVAAGQDGTVGLFALSDMKLPAPPSAGPGSVPLSAPVSETSDEWRRLTSDALSRRLRRAGLSSFEADFLTRSVSAKLFASDQFVVAAFVDFSALEANLAPDAELDPHERSRATLWVATGRTRPRTDE